MEHLALYRKFRPHNFEDVIGQDHIVKTLRGQIKNNQIGHAYLLCGTRGTGKTSIAKIFARAINCTDNHNGSPCEKCDTCISISNPNNMDILEIDAASNNRVDEIRDLREKVKYPPIVGKYKVYIIDEVHMLTDSAFNALLKTLEEPPSYVVFILATTDVQKVPATILSRCMRMDFRLVSIEDLEKHLEKVFKASNIECTPDALHLIAKSAEGSVRDALSIAEMCSAYTNGKITYADAIYCLGSSSNEVLYDICSSILYQNVEKLLLTIENLDREGKNFAVIGKDITTYFKNLILIKSVKDAQKILKLPEDIFVEMKKLADNFEIGRLLSCMNSVSTIEAELKYSINPKILVENITLSCLLCNNISILELEERINKLEQKQNTKKVDLSVNTISISQKNNNTSNCVNSEIIEKLEKQSELIVKNAECKESCNINNNCEKVSTDCDALKLWGTIVSKLRNSDNNILFALADKVVNVKNDKECFIISTNSEGSKKILEIPENISILENFIKQENQNYKIRVEFIENVDKNKELKEFLLSKFDNDIKFN